MFFVGKAGRKTKLRARDTVFLRQSFSSGKLEMCIERKKETLRWKSGNEVETLLGIHSVPELERTWTVVARSHGLSGVERCEPDTEHKKKGWIAFRFI